MSRSQGDPTEICPSAQGALDRKCPIYAPVHACEVSITHPLAEEETGGQRQPDTPGFTVRRSRHTRAQGCPPKAVTPYKLDLMFTLC